MQHVGLVLTGAARDIVASALARAGYEVHIAADMSRVKSLLARDLVQAWVFDARSEDVLELLLGTGSFLLPADDIPNPLDRGRFNDWLDVLLTQLDVALPAVPASESRAVGDWSKVRSVWLLAGSAGATGAVQEFFNAFVKPPPVAFIYAQHIDPQQQHQLEHFTLQNSQFSLQLARGNQGLEPGGIIMLSPRNKVSLNEFGRVSSTRAGWGGQHTPDINEMLIILSAARLPSPGVMIFSGMGDDGAASLRIFEAAGGRVWAQSPDSAVCRAMPQAAIDSGVVHKTGTPADLARALERLYSSF